MGARRAWKRVLIVEDDARLCQELRLFCEARGMTTRVSDEVQAALRCVREFQPELVLLDFRLADGNAIAFLEELLMVSPWPYCVACSGEAMAADAFDLARLGVRAFLPKPIEPWQLQAVLDDAEPGATELIPTLRALVGVESVIRVEDLVRETMVGEAMAQCHGNRSAAARLLNVSRQMLQHVLRSLGFQPL